jgi:predicted ATPase/class 3 adenylate cyclase
MIDPTVATVRTGCDQPPALPTPNRHRPNPTRFSLMLYVDVLGPVRAEVDIDDQRIDVTPKTGREQMALAALALAAPGALTVAGLAEVLYGDDEISDPRNAVQAVISRIRKALGPASTHIETTPAGYRLANTEVDVAAMEAQQNRGDTAGALAYWRGPTLAGLTGSDRIDNERTRLNELQSTLREQTLRTRLDDDPAAAVADLEAAVSEQPLREHRWELLMLALYRSGRQADALRAFRRARQHLGDELGLAPSPALVELEALILAQDRALDHTPPRLAQSMALPTGTVTVLLCDVEGSVRQWESRPSETASLIEEMHERWNDVVRDAGGVVVKSTGDGVLALFGTASDAVRAAGEGQRRQVEAGLRLRVALHTGEVINTGDDVRGPTVNRTARLLELAHGDQVLVSGTTAQVSGRTIADRTGEVGLRSLGEHWLRDVDEAVEVLQLVGDGLPSAFPTVRSAGPSQLPRPRNSLLGRHVELELLEELVSIHPLVTLLGTGGIGKTSLAVSVGWALADQRSVTFVDLAALQDPAQVAGRVAEILVGSDSGGLRSPEQRITDRLRSHPDLLIIDNAEHLLDAVAALVDQILRSELHGTILVTSRHPLTVDGEHVLTLAPLALPGADDDLGETARNAAVRLFTERMRATSPSAQLPDGLLPVVAHICRRLDGIPLAIELAAGRTALLAVQDIAARLDDQLRLLRQVPATREARHASLEAVARWSLDQLTPETRSLFAHLSVMAGAFDVAAAETVAAKARLDAHATLDGVSEMLAASLLATEADTGRVRMLEPIRQLALAELQAAGDEAAARRAHAEWMTDRAVEAHLMQDERRIPLFRSLEADADQLISALRWSSDQLVDEIRHPSDPLAADRRADRASELAIASAFWFLERDSAAGATMFEEMQERIDRERHPLAWARATIAGAIATATHPSTDRGDDALDAVAIFDAHESDERGPARLGAIFSQFIASESRAPELLAEAETLIPSDQQWSRAILDLVAVLIGAASATGDSAAAALDGAVVRGERAATVLRRLDDRWALGATLGELGRIHRARHEYDRAAACYHESIDLFGDLKYHGLHYIFSELGLLASLQGDHEQARRHHQHGVRLAIDDGNPGCHALALVGSARSELLAGNPAEAGRLARKARDLEPSGALFDRVDDELDQQLKLLADQTPD